MQGGVEKRVAGIIRWLERFQKAYRSGAMESALMDAECARADLEDLRHDVWSRVDPARTPLPAWGRVCRLSFSTALLLLATAAPLSTMTARELSSVHEEMSEIKEAKEIASVPREVEKPPVLDVKPQEAPAPKRAKTAAPPARAQARQTARGGGAESGEAQAPKKAVAYDKVFSLLQTGTRALKNEDPVIRIEKMDRQLEKGEGIL